MATNPNRDFVINGETMVSVKGRSDLSNCSVLTELGLTDRNGIVRVSPEFYQDDCDVDAWGQAPADVQTMLAAVTVTMTLVHVDRTLLDTCIAESMGGQAVGQLSRAGQRLGNNTPRFSPNGTLNPATGQVTTGNHYMGLNLSSPQLNKPWRFFFAYLYQNPVTIPLGAGRSLHALVWRAIPYTQDPYQGGLGAQGYPLWDYNTDS